MQDLYPQNEDQKHLSTVIESAPFPIAVYTGREMRITQANQAVIEVWGKGPEVIGKSYFQLLPELAGTPIYKQLIEVYDTGVPHHVRNQLVKLTVHGIQKEYYFNYSFSPLFDSNNNVYGVMNTAADVTDMTLAKQRAEFSEQNFRDMILQAPAAMCLLKGPDFIVDIANRAMLQIWGKPEEQVMGKPIFEGLPDAREQGLERVMEEVYRTGKPFYASEQPVTLVRHGKPDTVYQNFTYQPYRDADGSILGILATSVDVSQQVDSRIKLEKAYEQIQLSKKAAQLGMFDLDMEQGTMEWDERCRELFGIDHTEIVSYEHDFITGLHPEDRDRVTAAIDKLFSDPATGGDYDIEYRTIGVADGRIRWVRAKGKVYYSNSKPLRFIGSVLDITPQKINEQQLKDLAEKQARLAAVVYSSDDIIISKTLDGIITSWNPAAQRAFGYSEAEAIGKHISLIIPEERLSEEDYIISQIKLGKKVDHFETVRQGKSTHMVQLSLTVSPVVDENGNIIGASKIARDISTQLEAQQTAKSYTERLEIMNMVMSAVSEELDLNKILQKVTDATTELTGAKFGAFFYNTADQNGESYMLFTLSGAPREAFERFGMPRNTAVFHPTFAGEGLVRVDDITKDPRYAKNEPQYGMPKGHLPVISYLAVPVTSRNGKVIGGLFFGHPEPARFTAEHESLVISIAAQAAISIDNAKLFEEVKLLNDKKDEFIGLASHELKTPLASINGYLQILARMVSEERPKGFLEKATSQVSKLTGLVNDLLDVSKIEAGKLQLTVVPFDLCLVIADAVELVQHSTPKQRILFNGSFCPANINGDAQRIEQVVINLLSNAVKYAPAADLIDVEMAEREGSIVVSIIDHGPGIPADKLKNIFTRFYRIDEANPNISGLGIGLYLSHEIITRHGGEIWAESEIGKGCTFFFSLPQLTTRV